MKHPYTRFYVWAVATVFALAPAAQLARADTLVVPQVDANEESGGMGLGFVLGRVQTVYAASEFLQAMPLGGRITEIAFRVDGPLGNAVDGVMPDIELRMSTTTMMPSVSMRPFYTFAANIGPDETVVLPRGSLHLQSTWSRTGPNPFLLRVPFTTPFSYDPRAGNLLVDAFVYEPFLGRLTWDKASTLSVRQVGGAIGAAEAVFENIGPVTLFTFDQVPEPAVGGLLCLGFTALLAYRWKGLR